VLPCHLTPQKHWSKKSFIGFVFGLVIHGRINSTKAQDFGESEFSFTVVFSVSDSSTAFAVCKNTFFLFTWMLCTYHAGSFAMVQAIIVT